MDLSARYQRQICSGGLEMKYISLDGDGPEWRRQVAMALNAMQLPEQLAAPPANPVAGQTYFDTTTSKSRTWDGTAWWDLW